MNSRLNSILAFDKLLLLAVVVLLAMGLFVIYTGSNFHAMELGRPSYFYVLKHLRVILFGFVVLAFLTVLDHKIFHKLSHAMFLVCLVALAFDWRYVASALGTDENRDVCLYVSSLDGIGR